MPPRVISVLTAMQLFTVAFGVFVTGTLLRVHSARWPGAPFPAFPQSIRDYGLWLAILPIAWAVTSVLSVRSIDATPSVGSLARLVGLVLLTFLLLTFAASGFVSFQAATYTGLRSMQ